MIGSSSESVIRPIVLPEGRQATLSSWGAEGNEPMLFAPGLSESPITYSAVLGEMSQQAPDRLIVSPWWPGTHKSSPLGPAETYTSRMRDIITALGMLELEDASLAGHSAGGRLAAQVAALIYAERTEPEQIPTKRVHVASFESPGVSPTNDLALASGLMLDKSTRNANRFINNLTSSTNLFELFGRMCATVTDTFVTQPIQLFTDGDTLHAVNEEQKSFPKHLLANFLESGLWTATYALHDSGVHPSSVDKAGPHYNEVPGDHFAVVMETDPKKHALCASYILTQMGYVPQQYSTAA